SSGGALRNISSNNTWSGAVTLQSNSSVGVDADQLTISGVIGGAFNLIKVGVGTLTITNSSNSYNNTIISGGFLLLSNVAALPAAGNVIVHDGGTLRFQSGITGTRSLFLNGQGQGGAGAIESVAGANQWTSPIVLQSDSTVAVDADELRIPASIGGPGGLVKIGSGKLTLLNPDTFAGDTEVSRGILSVEHTSAIPAATTATVDAGAAIELRGGVSPAAALNLSGSGILNSGALRNPAGTNTWAGPITLKSNDVAIGVDAGAQLTVSGVISDGTDAFPLTKVGTGTLVLSAANTFDGTLINGGTLSISNNNQLGNSSGAVTTNNGGKLLVTANTITSRSFNLNTGSIEAASGVLINYLNATVNGGFLRGPGTHGIGAGSVFSGVTALNGSVIAQNAAATLTNFTNSGTIVNSAALTWDGGYNTAAGSILINSALTTTAFENTGAITISNGGNLTNNTSALVSGGGSRIAINSGGQLDVGGSSLQLNGALLVNNGTITGTTNVNFGSLAKGAGIYGAVNVTDGGRFSPGNSPGTVTTGPATWNSGGTYTLEMADALAGPGVGWDLWNIAGDLLIDSSSDPARQFFIALASISGDAAGPAAHFDSSRDYRWLIARSSNELSKIDVMKLTLDTRGFVNDSGDGQFLLSTSGSSLYISFNSVPDPSTASVLLASALFLRRRSKQI
ncbi:MAG TPA: autotransporter-associated beta strand repeat-containing protein, partial [Tepidisphaeraceae bacterium]|nr:autotransporter-associated beta strand repeat-containing protein [Tepidisphaeraceae bacterium]